MRKEIEVGDIVCGDDSTLYGKTPMEVTRIVRTQMGWAYAELRILFGPNAGDLTTESTLRLEHYTQE